MSAATINVSQRLRDLAWLAFQAGNKEAAAELERAAKMLDARIASLTSVESMRDRFAMAALTGLLAWPGDDHGGNHQTNNTPEGVADLSYAYADAMLKRRLEQ